MLFMKKDFFCETDPMFEENKKFNIMSITFDKEFIFEPWIWRYGFGSKIYFLY